MTEVRQYIKPDLLILRTRRYFSQGGGGSGGFRGVIWFSRGNERGISRCQKSIREGLWKIDCQLTATEEVVHKNFRGTSDLANVKVGGYH